jgi:hypothetical protein
MRRFIRRLIGAVALDAATYEDIEADQSASGQAFAVVALVCAAGGLVAMSRNRFSVVSFVAGASATVAAWLIWVNAIRTIGTGVMRESGTRSSTSELLRTLGFASAPGLLFSLAVIRPAAPFVLLLTGLWMIAAAVVGTRQALDYSSTARAAAVCVAAWLLSFGVVVAIALGLSRSVE